MCDHDRLRTLDGWAKFAAVLVSLVSLVLKSLALRAAAPPPVRLIVEGPGGRVAPEFG
jgi:hypothetical protein